MSWGAAARLGPLETGVACPRCADGALRVHRTCLATRLECGGCGLRFGLDQLARLLDDQQFAAVAEAVGDRLSDRV